MVQVAKAAGEEPPEFKNLTLYSNKGMEDLLKLNELASTVRTEIILPQSNKTGMNSSGFDENLHEHDNRTSTLG